MVQDLFFLGPGTIFKCWIFIFTLGVQFFFSLSAVSHMCCSPEIIHSKLVFEHRRLQLSDQGLILLKLWSTRVERLVLK